MINNIFNSYIKELHKINPTINDFFLKEEWNKNKGIQPNIYSDTYSKKLLSLKKKYLKKLNNTKKLSFQEKIMKNDLHYSILFEKERLNIYYYMPINTKDNILIDYVSLSSGQDIYTFKTKEDYHFFLQRLKSLTEITDEIIKKMKMGIQKKVTLDKQTIDVMISTINDIFKNRSYQHKKKILISKKKWNDSIQKYLIKNLQKLNNFLTFDYYQYSSKLCGIHQYKGGKDLYRHAVKYNTFKELTPEKIHQLGFRELKRAINEKKLLEKKLNKGDIDKYIINQKQDYYKDKKDIINDIHKIKKEINDHIFPKYFHGIIQKKDDYIIKSVRLENKNHFAYYRSKNLKGSVKGTFFINTFIPQKIYKHELYVLTLHEGIPGHHYEVNLHINMDRPDYFKSMLYSSYSEGWALYCESLGKFNNIKRKYFLINYNLLRSIRLIIDTGLHYYGWSYNKCFNFMKKYINHSDGAIHSSIIRYINNPCQALTYKIGEKTILYLKDRYLRNGGNIKDFHKIIMGIGPCPIGFLLDYFLENEKA